MMMLALDTSTSAIAVAVHDGNSVLAEHAVVDARAHTEHLAPLIEQALATAQITPADLTDIAVGVGPGPFTGLRVGLVTARTMAYALGIPCHGVVSLDALAHDAVRSGTVSGASEFVVATDARRKEVYLARYAVDDSTVAGEAVEAREARRLSGPDVIRPADIDGEARALPAVGRGAQLYPEVFAVAAEPLDVSAAALAAVALSQLADGIEVGLDALYLRRPDAQPSPGAKSTITAERADRS